MIKKITLLPILIMLATIGFAQNVQVSGNIKDTSTKVNVHLKEVDCES